MDEPLTFHFYKADTDLPPAGVAEAYLYVWSGQPGPARYMRVAMVEDGDGNGFIAPAGAWEDCTVTAD